MEFTANDLEWLNKRNAAQISLTSDDVYRLSLPNCQIDVERGTDGNYKATATDNSGQKLASNTCDCLRGAIASCLFSLENKARRLQGMASEIFEVLK